MSSETSCCSSAWRLS